MEFVILGGSLNVLLLYITLRDSLSMGNPARIYSPLTLSYPHDRGTLTVCLEGPSVAPGAWCVTLTKPFHHLVPLVAQHW